MSRHARSIIRPRMLLLAAPLLLGAGCQRPGPAASQRPADATPAKKASPKIACAQPTHAFGTVEEGKKVEHVFTVKNEGNGLLQIARTTAG